MEFLKDKFYDYYKVDFDFEIKNTCSLNNPQNNSISFANKLNSENIGKISNFELLMFITFHDAQELGEKIKNIKTKFISCDNPRLEYIRSLRNFFSNTNTVPNNPDKAYIDTSSVIHPSVKIGPFSFIGPGCVLEDGIEIAAGVQLIENVEIKKNTIIGPGTIIGSIGFGVERDSPGPRKIISFEGEPMKMPHFGGVFIDENCHIGALNTIVAGAIDPTYIGKNVQIDDHCHIAHNCIIEEGVLIVASAGIGGSVTIGENSWIGFGSTLMQKIKIGKRNTIGLGAAILKSTGDDEVWAGNPAKLLKKNNNS
tara:strand:- start:4821 stop:5753 length:933 start_codon:yes stop_codon:yes gene_type:complete